jgi:phosphate transport system substrate-binding protein
MHSQSRIGRYCLVTAAVLGFILTAAPIRAQLADLLEGIPPYLPKAPVKGVLKVAGSSTMNQLAHLWTDGIKAIHPEAKIDIRMIGSGEVPGLLAKDETEIGLMSRSLTKEERERSKKLTAIPVAKDVVCFVVHPENPYNHLTHEQLQMIVASTKDKMATTWGDLGAEGEWAKVPVKLYGRSDRSGVRGYLSEQFGGSAGLDAAKECTGYTEICEEVAKDRGGIGYVSLSLFPPGVAKVVGMVDTKGKIHEAPRADRPVDAAYPLVRQLFVVLKGDGSHDEKPLCQEWLQYVLSRQGQGDAIRAGLLPLRRDEVLMSRDQLGWTGTR